MRGSRQKKSLFCHASIAGLPCLFVFFLFLFLFLPARRALAHVRRGEVIVITYDGVINPVAAQYIDGNIEYANERRAQALILELDTPGGLDKSMRTIIKAIGASAVPVVTYVAPSGSRAASAGAFITLASHVAAMAPETNIGAAHPVEIGGHLGKTMQEKVTNDAVAYIKSIAQLRGRNQKWAEQAVRQSISSPASEALKEGVINLIAPGLASLLKKLDGWKTVTAAGPRVIRTSGARVVMRPMGFRLKVLALLSDPNVSYILMLLGFYGIFFEILSPGAILPGVIGAISFILAFYSFSLLPVNFAGLLLIVIAIVMFVLDVKMATHGALTIGGIAAMILGSLMLFSKGAPFLSLSLSVIVPAALITALFFFFTVRLAVKARRRKPVTGVEGLKGEIGVASTAIGAEGTVRVHGEFWSAWSEEPVGQGEKVEVLEAQGLRLKVKRAEK